MQKNTTAATTTTATTPKHEKCSNCGSHKGPFQKADGDLFCSKCAEDNTLLMPFDKFVNMASGEIVLAIGKGDFRGALVTYLDLAHRRGYNNAKR